MSQDIQPSSVVKFKSGGPRMTVARIIKDGQQVECHWFLPDESKATWSLFRPEILEPLGRRPR